MNNDLNLLSRQRLLIVNVLYACSKHLHACCDSWPLFSSEVFDDQFNELSGVSPMKVFTDQPRWAQIGQKYVCFACGSLQLHTDPAWQPIHALMLLISQ